MFDFFKSDVMHAALNLKASGTEVQNHSTDPLNSAARNGATTLTTALSYAVGRVVSSFCPVTHEPRCNDFINCD